MASEDYFGVGLRKGMLHLVWNLGWLSRTELTVPRPLLSDGAWHKIRVDRSRQSTTLRIDGETFGSRVKGSYFQLNVDDDVFFGGAAASALTLDMTRGHFDANFKGCLRNVSVQNSSVSFNAVDVDAISGVNIVECSDSV